jgi:hypothetical protein
VNLGHPPRHSSIFYFILPLEMTVIYIYIYKDIGRLVPLHP